MYGCRGKYVHLVAGRPLALSFGRTCWIVHLVIGLELADGTLSLSFCKQNAAPVGYSSTNSCPKHMAPDAIPPHIPDLRDISF